MPAWCPLDAVNAAQPFRAHLARGPCLRTWPASRRNASKADTAAAEQTAASQYYVDMARRLAPVGSTLAQLEGAAALLHGWARSRDVQASGFYWYFLVALFGLPRGSVPDASRTAWDLLFQNFTHKLKRLRSRSLAPIRRTRLHLWAEKRPGKQTDSTAEAASSLVVYGHNAAYFKEPHVEPFVRHLRCYAEARGVRFVADHQGSRVHHDHIGILEVDLPNEYFLSLREKQQHLAHVSLRSLLIDLLSGQSNRAGDLVGHERFLGINQDDPAKFSKVWAVAEELERVKSGGLAVYFDVDVTIRPDSLHRSLVQLLLQEHMQSGQSGHFFVADTWSGTECVNTGFFAFRNTELARIFLDLWREKLWWPASWDQGALAETILEVAGAEAWKVSDGGRGYYSHCLPLLFPIPDGTYPWQNYCDCWHMTLEDLVGPYRRRQSKIITFVDPESLEVNFVPNNLFADHAFDLSRMRLLPFGDPLRPALEPLVVHWAGLGRERTRLMEEYLAARFNLSAEGCPQSPQPTAENFGTQARLLRCCEQFRAHANRSEWPWTEPVPDVHAAWWGCRDWQAATDKACEEILGKKLQWVD